MTFWKGFIMSTVDVEFPNIESTICLSSRRHLRRHWVIHLLFNYLKVYEAMMSVVCQTHHMVLGCKVSGKIFGLWCLHMKLRHFLEF